MSNLVRLANRVEDGILVLLLTSMIALAGTQIFLRNFLETGFAWGEPLIRVLVLWISLMGAMVASRYDNHISIDVLSRFLPPRIKNIGRALTDLLAATVCAVLAYHGGRLVLLEKESGTIAFASVPTWICELIIPIGFGVIALRFTLLLFQHLSHAISPKGTTVTK